MFSGVKIECKQETSTTYMSLRHDFVLSLIVGLRIVLFCVICNSAGCSVVWTQGLKRITIAIPLSSSRDIETAIQKAF